MSDTIKRPIFPVPLSKDEKELFKLYSETKGWALSKFVRIAARAFILQDKKKLDFTSAINKAVYMEKFDDN